MATDTDTLADDIDVPSNGTADSADAATDTGTGTDSGRAQRRAPVRRSRPGSGRATVSDDGRPLLTIAVGVLVAALIGATTFFGIHYFTDSPGTTGPSEQTRTEAIDVSRDYAIKLSSFDYRDLNKNRDSIAAMSTPDFAKKYSEMVGALTQIVTDGKGEASAEVSHAAIETIDDTSATVLLFVDQKAKNVVSPDGKIQPYRMVVTLKRGDGRWLVDNVETR